MRTKYGQNFLTDKNIAKKIVDAAKIEEQDTVVEIGPGKGIITELIAKKTDKLVAIEIDKNLANNLKLKFPKAEIINADVLELNFEKMNFLEKIHSERIYSEKKAVFIGNLPYYISTAIVRKIIPSNCWKRAIFTFQKEVAERITAVPSQKNPKNYGYLSVFTSYYAETKILLSIPPSAFCPKPKITSAVVEFTPSKGRRFDNPLAPFVKGEYGKLTELFEKIIETAFSQRRKTILNNLANSKNFANLIGDKESVKKILNLSGIQPNTRPEQIDLNGYKKLTENISNNSRGNLT